MTSVDLRRLSGLLFDMAAEQWKKEQADTKPVPDEPPTPKRVWNCQRRGMVNCGVWPVETKLLDGIPFSWHDDCWYEHQIKELWRMVGELRSHRCCFGSPDTFVAWVALCDTIDTQLAALYPGKKE